MTSATTTHATNGLDALRFDNAFVRELPGDVEAGSRRRQVARVLHSPVEPTPTAAPRLVAFAPEVLELLGLDAATSQDERFERVFSGNALLAGMQPFATCYGGHQFGNWAGQLGDGRAINLGEVVNGDRRYTLQLKGAGPTPYSRTADGLAVLRSSVREFLCSEAMHHLGVPTTRALSLCLTGDEVVRDMLYDGHPAAEPGAVVCRVSPSFLRFGHFQMLAARDETDLLAQLLDFDLRHNFAALGAVGDRAERALTWFAEVCDRTRRLMVHWMRVGFVHGVMNTDNLSILGETIDYGPYGWLEDYDPDWTPNTTDAGQKRYRYGYQPAIAQWNLLQLANAIYPLVGEAEPLESQLKAFETEYASAAREMWSAKLGLTTPMASEHAARDSLIEAMDAALRSTEIDMPIFFRALADVDARAHDDPFAALEASAYGQVPAAARAALNAFLNDLFALVRQDNQPVAERRQRMNAVNPKYVLRNYMAQLAIDAAEGGDFSRINELLDVLRTPYAEQPGREEHAARRPEWARTRVGCSMLSCSS
ncbi:MAG: YdiU family protein [Pseudomonadota bacterium]